MEFIYGESANQTMMRLSNQFTPIVEEGADTLIHIGPPPKAKGQTDSDYAYVKRAFERPHLLKSETLRKLGSAKFNELLGPKSKRTQRKLQKAGIHKLLVEPEKIKYFIDLTPDIHDDEGMVLLLELSAPSGARSWHRDAQRFSINSSHVCGRDAFDMLPKPILRPDSQNGPNARDQDASNSSESAKTPKGKTDANRKASGKGEKSQKSFGKVIAQSDFDTDTTEDEQAPQEESKPVDKKDEPYNQHEEEDYSQLRHHTAIVRLLQAIAGQDPKLNSAPKAWTFCMLAKFFDCAKNELISGWTIDWLVQSGNINFIQVNPSTAYRFGMAMEAVWLVRTSFCIMVGLKAFEHVKSITDASLSAQGRAPSSVPRSSRITDGLDDDDINRVDHAALALVKRVQDQVHRLFTEGGECMNGHEAGTEMAKLFGLDFADLESKETLGEVKKSLDRYVRRQLCSPFVEFDDTTGHHGNMFKPPMNITSYHLVPALLRPLTLQFWEAIRSRDLVVDTSFTAYPGSHERWAQILGSLRDEGVLTAESLNIPYISKSHLSMALDLLNSIRFGPDASEWPGSPKKKVKLSSRSKKRNMYKPPPIAEGFKQTAFMEHFEPAQPSTFLRPNRTQPLADEEKTSFLHQNDTQFDAESVQNKRDEKTEEDDWEDILGDLEAQPQIGSADRWLSPDGLAFRNKATQARVSPVVTSGEMSQSLAKEKLPSPRGSSLKFSEDLIGDLHQSFSEPQPFQYPTAVKYGNPGRSRPSEEPEGLIFSNELCNQLRNALEMKRDAASSSNDAPQQELYVTDSYVETEPAQAYAFPEFPSVPNFPSSNPEDTPIFIDSLLMQVSNQIKYLIRPILLPGFMADNCCAYDVPLNEIGTLTCLSDEEYKYLPLWAGGNDDGSGGVFDDGEDIPEAPEVEFGGFRGGAMGIIPGVGSTIGGSVAGSEFEEISTEVGRSTVGKASRIATDGEDTVMSLDE